MDSSIPFERECLRSAEIGIEISAEMDSQLVMPDSQRRFSVIAPIPWMWMNVLVSISVYATKELPSDYTLLLYTPSLYLIQLSLIKK